MDSVRKLGGVDLDLDWKNPQRQFATALHEACTRGFLECALFLIAKGSCVYVCVVIPRECQSHHMLLSCQTEFSGASVSVKDVSGATPLHKV